MSKRKKYRPHEFSKILAPLGYEKAKLLPRPDRCTGPEPHVWYHVSRNCDIILAEMQDKEFLKPECTDRIIDDLGIAEE